MRCRRRRSSGGFTNARAGSVQPVFPSSPATPWFLRVTFPGVLPGAAAVAAVAAAAGLPVERVADHATAQFALAVHRPAGPPRPRRGDRQTVEHASHRRRRLPQALRPMDPEQMHFATRAIHSAQPSDPSTGALDRADLPDVDLRAGKSRRQSWLRLLAHQQSDAPAARRGPCRISKASSHCAVFASGLAAEHAVLHAYLRPHDEIIVPLDVYGGTFRLLNRVFAGFDLTDHAGRYGRSRRGARGDHRAHAAGLARDADQSAADRVGHPGDRRHRAPDTARSSSSTTRSRRRSSSSRSRSAPTSSSTASRSTSPATRI